MAKRFGTASEFREFQFVERKRVALPGKKFVLSVGGFTRKHVGVVCWWLYLQTSWRCLHEYQKHLTYQVGWFWFRVRSSYDEVLGRFTRLWEYKCSLS